MALDAIIFDIDGTLLDSNAMHVEAFVRAFASHSYKIAPDRIAVEIGKGGDNLVPAIIGPSADKKDGDAIRKQQPKEFAKLAAERRISVFPKVRELLAEARGRGLKIVVATSSGKEQLETLSKYSGFDIDGEADVLVNADDTENSKPAPDLIVAAVKKSGLSPAQCVMIGDTPWDAESAKHGGVVTFGVLCGGANDTETLMGAGARRVYKDPANLLAQLDEALMIASPGPIHLTQDRLAELMRHGLVAARDGMADGEAPIGAVLARSDGTVIARGWNRLNKTRNKTAHAEMVAFAEAAGKVPADARDLILVSTLEPCVMCTGAAMVAAVDTILYGLRAPADAGTARVAPPRSPESQMPRIIGDVLAAESLSLFQKWYEKHKNEGEQAAYVRQLLERHHAL
jgi:HAD superfamily hydrolase (TIGR01509 family)